MLAKVRRDYKPSPKPYESAGARPADSASLSSGKVTVKVRWIPHPFDEAALSEPEEKWSFVVDRVRLAHLSACTRTD